MLSDMLRFKDPENILQRQADLNNAKLKVVKATLGSEIQHSQQLISYAVKVVIPYIQSVVPVFDEKIQES
ncbi:hypothetical protein HDU98_002746 [Podochytrium sp. JEL0797]|nr:hypothetical protein HDU98_002746 [Podochytrium sp. JEL0797]